MEKNGKRRFVNDFDGDTENLKDDKNIMIKQITMEGKNHWQNVTDEGWVDN